jgi:colicin import membrane protein
LALAMRGPYDDLLPRAPGGAWRGVALSLLAHGALFAALMWGVRWSTPATDIVAAELWAAVPQAAAPAPVVPPPAPAREPEVVRRPAPPTPAPNRDADIALEKAEKARIEKARADERTRQEKARQDKERQDKERQEKEARDKREKETKARAEVEKREKAAADAQLARQREQNLERMMGQLGSGGTPGARAASGPAAGPSSSYAGRIVAAIKPNIVFADTLPGNPAAEVEVRAGPSGTILGRTLIKSSGHADWDEAVLRAIDRTARLPPDTDGRVQPRMIITFRPRD